MGSLIVLCQDAARLGIVIWVHCDLGSAFQKFPFMLLRCPQAGDSPLEMGPKAEVSGKLNTNPLSFLLRMLLGTLAGFYYFVVPVYMYIKNLVVPQGKEL